MDEILNILSCNARTSLEDIAKQTGLSIATVAEKIASYEKEGIIRGYHAIINDEQLGSDHVTALIEVRVMPEREGGFDDIARRVSKFPEVRSSYLVSGAYDFMLIVDGNDLRRVAAFVSEKLATIPGVTGTATHFLLKTYKHRGVMMEDPDEQERLKISP